MAERIADMLPLLLLITSALASPTLATLPTQAAQPAALGPERFAPAFHQRPPCYNKQTPHDIAGALFVPETKTWHVMAGCWQYPLKGWRQNPGGWQHLTSVRKRAYSALFLRSDCQISTGRRCW